MVVIVFSMIIILGVAAAIVGLVALGMQGRGRDRAPVLANKMARAAEHLNGEGEPPERFRRFIESAQHPGGRPSRARGIVLSAPGPSCAELKSYAHPKGGQHSAPR